MLRWKPYKKTINDIISMPKVLYVLPRVRIKRSDFNEVKFEGNKRKYKS